MDKTIKLRTKWVGQKIHYYDVTDSTNLRAKDAALAGEASGTLFVAGQQTAGRGRRGRAWESPPGVNLYFSLLLRPKFELQDVSMLTLLMAMAVTRVLREELEPMQNRCKAGIKWPNDVVADGKKLCGILTELGMTQNDEAYLVIGTGINEGHQAFAGELSRKATALEDVLGRRIEHAELLQRVLLHFEELYERFAETADMSRLAEEYEGMLLNRGERVRVLDPAGEYDGVAEGINARGELLVRKDDKTVSAVYAGEVSVRGIYGYT